jgi:iduronate 2-sulfatase
VSGCEPGAWLAGAKLQVCPDISEEFLMLRTVTVLSMAALLVVGCGAVARSTHGYNVVMIVADDLNTDVGCFGKPVVTPNIDELASRGMRFDRAYCQFPLCNPSRTSFLSGRRPETTGVLDNMTPPRIKLGGVEFLPEYFKRFGYFAGRVGKIEHTEFEASGVIHWDIARDAVEQDYDTINPGHNAPSWAVSPNDDEDEPDGQSARQFVEMLQQQAGKPFFLALGFLKPHRPFVAPRKYFDFYTLDSIELPPGEGNSQLTDQEKREIIRAYRASISFIDAQVGFVVQGLRRLNLMENTVIVFTSDHGLHVGEHDRFGKKQSLQEGVARVPLVVVVPGAPGRQSTIALVELVDLYPTLAELCGLPAPVGVEGTSFVPLLDSPSRPWKVAAFTTNKESEGISRAVRDRRYRYIEHDDGTQELYDYDTDPLETNNLAHDRKSKRVKKELQRLLRQST